METTKRLCRFCKEAIDLRIGRKDRKFCDEKCKNSFHNTQHYEEAQELKRIDLRLKKNRRILKKLFSRKDKEKIPRDMLLQAGFDFEYHTHNITTVTKRNNFTFCYDYGYRDTGGGVYHVIKRFETVENNN